MIFHCQQAVEKRLKGLIVKRTEQFPPRVHSLKVLAEAACLELDADREQLFRQLSELYLAVRYPDVGGAHDLEDEEQTARDSFARTEEVIEWLDQLLKQDE